LWCKPQARRTAFGKSIAVKPAQIQNTPHLTELEIFFVGFLQRRRPCGLESFRGHEAVGEMEADFGLPLQGAELFAFCFRGRCPRLKWGCAFSAEIFADQNSVIAMTRLRAWGCGGQGKGIAIFSEYPVSSE
jgi:hypothetical protein